MIFEQLSLGIVDADKVVRSVQLVLQSDFRLGHYPNSLTSRWLVRHYENIMASGKRKRDRELVAESSRSSKKHKHSSTKRDYTSREDAKPSTSSRKRNRQSRSVSVSQALAMKREARDESAQSSATLQDEVKVEQDADASILFVDGPGPKKKRKHKTKAKKEDDDLASGQLKVEPDELQAIVTIASSAPVLLDPKTEDALEEDIKPVLEDVKPSPTISKKDKGKGKEEGWAVGLASSPRAADPPVVAAIAHVQDPEVERLKLEIERMQKELLFKDEVLSFVFAFGDMLILL